MVASMIDDRLLVFRAEADEMVQQIFETRGPLPWEEFLDEIYQRYPLGALMFRQDMELVTGLYDEVWEND